MDWLLKPLTEAAVYQWETNLGNWFFYLSLAYFSFELIRYVLIKKMSWTLAGDSVTNFITFGAFLVLSYVLLGAVYVSAYFYFQQFALFEIGVSWMTVIVCVIAADLAYYWEHRFTHRVGMAWATHTVHHSSPYFNISVAYRFGPLDSLWGIFFHLPLVLAGFNPFIVFFASAFVQLYQTILHTEVIDKLPRPVEYVFNTPSHHRVHHGANEQYIDRNYSGILIIWDRMFGTFAEEREPVSYGITRPLNSVNPFIVFFHGLARLAKQVADVPGLGNKFKVLVKPPGWEPRASVSTASDKTTERASA